MTTSINVAVGLTLVPVLVLAALFWLRDNLQPDAATRVSTGPFLPRSMRAVGTRYWKSVT